MKFHMPTDAKAQGEVVKAQVATQARQTEMGIMGSMFGGAIEKPGNIAAFVIVASVVGIVVVLMWLPEGGSVSKKDALTVFGGFITLALGYVFGRGGKSAERD
jgi:hypothetical protein